MLREDFIASLGAMIVASYASTDDEAACFNKIINHIIPRPNYFYDEYQTGITMTGKSGHEYTTRFAGFPFPPDISLLKNELVYRFQYDVTFTPLDKHGKEKICTSFRYSINKPLWHMYAIERFARKSKKGTWVLQESWPKKVMID